MAQTFKFIDDTSYDDTAVAEVFEDFYGESFVVPNALNNLDDGSGVAGVSSLVIQSGLAVHQGIFYENDDDEGVVLDSQGGGLNRIDRVVLRRDNAAQTVRITVIKGTAAASPSVPALTANDMPLYYVYIPDGFTSPSTGSIYVYDERTFSYSAPFSHHINLDNLIRNSEFMADSQLGGTSLPDLWQSSAGTFAAAAALGDMPRGRAIELDTGNMYQMIYPPTDLYNKYEPTYDDIFTLTLKGIVNATDSWSIAIFGASLGSPYTILSAKTFYRAGEYEFVIRFELDWSLLNADDIQIIFTSGGVVEIGQLLLVRGYVPGPLRPVHEFIWLLDGLNDTDWDLTAFAKSDVDLSADFGGYILRGTRLVMGILGCRDAASAANEANVRIIEDYKVGGGAWGAGTNSQQDVGTLANDSIRHLPLYAGVSLDANYGFYINGLASGAGALDAYLEITGIVV